MEGDFQIIIIFFTLLKRFVLGLEKIFNIFFWKIVF